MPFVSERETVLSASESCVSHQEALGQPLLFLSPRQHCVLWPQVQHAGSAHGHLRPQQSLPRLLLRVTASAPTSIRRARPAASPPPPACAPLIPQNLLRHVPLSYDCALPGPSYSTYHDAPVFPLPPFASLHSFLSWSDIRRNAWSDIRRNAAMGNSTSVI
eukprot:4371704-Pleurochrysis_carterae.AAC.2